MAYGIKGKGGRNVFFVADHCHAQTVAVVKTRAEPLGIEVEVGPYDQLEPGDTHFGALVQYPGTDGTIHDFDPFIGKVREAGALSIVACDLLALTLLKPPGEMGADIAIGSAQRFGVPLGFGGPHAAFLATRDRYKRQMPGRLVGVSKDVEGHSALRLSLQTREQHIRRDRATSNICTAQVLLAVMASMYAIYHGPVGLRRIAERIRNLTLLTGHHLRKLGYEINSGPIFDTLTVHLDGCKADQIHLEAHQQKINLREVDSVTIGLSLDEATTLDEIAKLVGIFAAASGNAVPTVDSLLDQAPTTPPDLPKSLNRSSTYLTHPVFNRYQTETELLRYIRRLESRDLSLCHSMISLGSCTMKLNATTESIVTKTGTQ